MKTLNLVKIDPKKDLAVYKIWRARYVAEYNKSGTRGQTIRSDVPMEHWNKINSDEFREARGWWIKLGTRVIGYVTAMTVVSMNDYSNQQYDHQCIEDMYIDKLFRGRNIAVWVRQELVQAGIKCVLQDQNRLGKLYLYYLQQGYRSLGVWADAGLCYISQEEANDEKCLLPMITDKIKNNPEIMSVINSFNLEAAE
jgi:hypothetical protein